MAANPAVRALILTGAGKSFSAGADLGWMKRMAGYSYEENLADAAGLAQLMNVLDRLPKPTIGLINGAAYGGGVGLVACCDIVVASATRECSACPRSSSASCRPRSAPMSSPRSGRARHGAISRPPKSFRPTRRGASAWYTRWWRRTRWRPRSRQDPGRDASRVRPSAQADSKDLVFTVDRPLTDEVMTETGRRIALRRASEEGREGIGAFLAKREPAWRKDI